MKGKASRDAANFIYTHRHHKAAAAARPPRAGPGRRHTSARPPSLQTGGSKPIVLPSLFSPPYLLSGCFPPC